MLPSGSSTVGALMTMVTGMASSNLYLTTMPEALANPYITATAPQMKNLGYETSFWYAGPATWENIQEFTLAQGFDNFYSRGNIDLMLQVAYGALMMNIYMMLFLNRLMIIK